MKEWHVYGKIHASVYLGSFKAETKEQAEEMALSKASVSLCNQCSRKCEDPEVVSAEAEEA